MDTDIEWKHSLEEYWAAKYPEGLPECYPLEDQFKLRVLVCGAVDTALYCVGFAHLLNAKGAVVGGSLARNQENMARYGFHPGADIDLQLIGRDPPRANIVIFQRYLRVLMEKLHVNHLIKVQDQSFPLYQIPEIIRHELYRDGCIVVSRDESIVPLIPPDHMAVLHE